MAAGTIPAPRPAPPEEQPPPQQPAPPDVNIPTLTYNGGYPRPLTGEVPAPDFNTPTGDPDAAPPSNPPFRILPSSIRDAEATITTPLKDAIDGVDGWHDLTAYIDRVKHWIFYRPEHSSYQALPTIYPTEDSRHAPPSQDALDMVSYLDNLMFGAADSIMTVGEYISRLHMAGQTYVAADMQSVFPSA